MKSKHGIVSSLVLLAALSVPTVMKAGGAPQLQQVADHDRRVYDRDHRDYHHWDRNEAQAYKNWYVETHRPYRDYGKLNRTRQAEYWKWRHDHDDHDRH